jgi:peptidoglycan/LPS O-acetylase OafA/YrhL
MVGRPEGRCRPGVRWRDGDTSFQLRRTLDIVVWSNELRTRGAVRTKYGDEVQLWMNAQDRNLDGREPKKATGRIVGLDGLRAISIALVLIGHGLATIPASFRPDYLAPYLGNATLGVMTFFVVSGFLITHLLRQEWGATGTLRLKAFYARRILRIFPALYAYLLVLTLIRIAGWIDTTWADLGVAGTFLTNYKHAFPIPTNDDYWFVGHFWTLSLEEQFYLFWPATILAFGIRRAPRIALGIVLATPLVRVVTYFLWPEARGQLGLMLHTAADPIMVGCLAALWQGEPSFEAVLRRFSRSYVALAASLFLLFASPWLASQFQGMYSMTVGMSLNSIAIAYIMLWVIRHPEHAVVRFLSTPVVRHVGVLSYSLYLWQQLFLTTRNESWTGSFPINLLVCFAVAELSYRVVEQPFLRLRDRFRGKSAVGLASADAAVLAAGRAADTTAAR